MVVVALCCIRQSRAPNIDRCAPEIWPWPWPLTLTLTLALRQCNSDVKHDFWHLTLTFDLQPNLAKVKVDLHTKNQGHKSNGSVVRVDADGRYQVHYLPALRLIKTTPFNSICQVWYTNNEYTVLTFFFTAFRHYAIGISNPNLTFLIFGVGTVLSIASKCPGLTCGINIVNPRFLYIMPIDRYSHTL